MTVPALDSLPKGHVFPTCAFELTPEWVGAYAAATEDTETATLGGDLVPPMAIASLAVRALLDAASLPEGTVHVAQDVTFQRAARVGDSLSVDARILSRGERQGWLLMGIELAVATRDGEPVLRGRATITTPAGGGR
jgi:acyl dehydratase